MRLRSILRKRDRRKGVGCGLDHQRWPNNSLPFMGCSPWLQPENWPVNSQGGEPPTGEPDAGKPHVRFGGRGDAIQCIIPTPIFSCL